MNLKKALPKEMQSKLLAPELKQEEGFAVKYANHVSVYPSGWDLRLTFGNVDTPGAPNRVLQHTSISLPWPTVKCLAYLLSVQLKGYEIINGHVPMPYGGIFPPEKSIPPALKNIPRAEEVQTMALRLWDEFTKENPEVLEVQNQQE